MDQNFILEFFNNYPSYAILISIVFNVIIAVLGLLPSVFITTANVLFFGVFEGFLISVLGEAIGAIVSFKIYRLGFKKISSKLIEKNKKVKAIVDADKKDLFQLIFLFRIFPYMPSGIVTYAAAIGNVSTLVFSIASTLGKIPALIIEVLVSVAIIEVAQSQELNILITIGSIVLIVLIIRTIIRRNNERN